MKIYSLESDDTEIIAVIMAAVRAYCGDEVSIKVINRIDANSIWARMGKRSVMAEQQNFMWK